MVKMVMKKRKGLGNFYRINKKYTMMLLDFIFILIAYFISFLIRYKFINVDINFVISMYISKIYKILLASSLYIIFFIFFKQYENIWSLASIDEFISGLKSIFSTGTIIFFVSILDENRIPLLISALTLFIASSLCISMRISYMIIDRKSVV